MSFPEYDSYRDSVLGRAPKHWGVVPLKYVASYNDEVVPEGTDPTKEFLYVDISSVAPNEGITGKESIIFCEAPSRARRRVREGDVIVSTVRTYLRAVARITNPEHNLLVSTGFTVVRPGTELLSRFAGFVLTSTEFVDQVIARSVGVSYPAINAEDLVRISILLPPLQEQQAIADFLDRETAKIDTLVAEQRRLIELLKEKRQAVINQAVTKGLDPNVTMMDSGEDWLGEVPSHWNIFRMASLYTNCAEEGDSTLPVLQVSIHHGVSDKELSEEESDRKITRIEDKSKYKRVKPNDLVYNMMRAWQGGFGSVEVEGMVSPAYVVARPRRHDVVSEFVEHILRTPNAIEQMRRLSEGVTDFRLRLYWDRFRDVRVAIPPRTEQLAICVRIQQIDDEVNNLMKESEKLISLLQEHRSSMISAAVTGKIDVRHLSNSSG